MYTRGQVSFRADVHEYTVLHKGVRHKVGVSATGLVKRFFPPFEPRAVAKRGISRWTKHPVYGPIIAESDDPVAAICSMWAEAGTKAAEHGTRVHAWAEAFVGGFVPAPIPGIPECDHIRRFVAGSGLVPAAAELRVWFCKSDRPVLAGTVDALFTDGQNNHVLVDWKCSAKPLDGPAYASGTGPLARLAHTKLVVYSLQAHLYAIMLRQSRKIEVRRLLLVRLTPDKAETTEALPLRAEAEALIETL